MTRNQWWWVAILGAGVAVYAAVRAQSAERIPGGLSSGKRPSEFDSAELRKGIQVELEHTSDPDIAQEIAMDHLTEDSHYYEKLSAAGL